MKLILGGILTVLVLAGCSTESTTSPTPQTGGKPGPATKGRDMCAVLPGPEAAKALGVSTAKAEPDRDGACWYSGMPECGQQTARDCSVIVEYATGGWQDDSSGLTDPVAGLGEKANYNSSGILTVKVGANDALVIKPDSKVFGGDFDKMKQQSISLAKAVVAKL